MPCKWLLSRWRKTSLLFLVNNVITHMITLSRITTLLNEDNKIMLSILQLNFSPLSGFQVIGDAVAALPCGISWNLEKKSKATFTNFPYLLCQIAHLNHECHIPSPKQHTQHNMNDNGITLFTLSMRLARFVFYLWSWQNFLTWLLSLLDVKNEWESGNFLFLGEFSLLLCKFGVSLLYIPLSC